MPVVLPAPLRIATVALGITATGLFVEPIVAAPPTAFRVSPKVMQRLRGTPTPAPLPTPETPAPEAVAPTGRTAVPAPADSVAPVPAPPELPTPATPPPPLKPAPASAAPTAPPTGTAALPNEAAAGDWAPGDDVEERDWRWIVVHHTATEAGSVEAIHRAHSRRRDADGNPWRGIGYHFLIGNGDGMTDGAVEATFRWRDQLAGAHAGRRAENERGVGVCLVGDFESVDPSPAQLDAARRLIAFLRDRYDVPADRVLPHDAVAATACPGKRLTIEMLLDPAAVPVAALVPEPAAAAAPVPVPAAAPVPAAVPAPAGDDEDDYLPTGLSAPAADDGPSLTLPRFRSQDAP
ncbi:peptidoglycan recognition protein family protein [Alienimonas californiensis]|uniref:N-acetylmuramoyl-L-alanine amidase n=1 Tax=Alienimonas californiensis TaxID=2527989 RepID=A0A517PAR3_9PLAN|nr:peptidoglycan recognition family protein [Alienimonas californiensis]QDT16465.1 N-acetylmuramoyl-L-alanine amidase [Alienimonas californiensis]